MARVRRATQLADRTAADPAAIAAERLLLGRGPSAPLLDADPARALLARLARNQAGAVAVADRSAAVRAIADYLAGATGSRKLVAANEPQLAALPWREAGLLPRFGAVEDADPVAVSQAHLAVAETGSIVLCSTRGSPPRNALLAEHHIVLVDAADIVRTLDDIWPELERRRGAGPGPRAVQIISGPSSTADIALNMVYGAHGPRALQVILLCAPG
jgi:L-lactate dehydrogenase complex protein LldG